MLKRFQYCNHILLLAVLGLLCLCACGKQAEEAVDSGRGRFEDNAQGGAEENTASKRTIMFYMIGSDLESKHGAATDDLKEIQEAAISKDTSIVIQTGGCSDWQNDFCRDNTVQRFCCADGKLSELEDLGGISMADADTLKDFIVFASENYPAEDYVLVLWDHGYGIPIRYGKDELYPEDGLYAYQIGQALNESGVHFDSVIFDSCNMCTLEVGMALKDSADYMIAAESSVRGAGLSYRDWIGSFENASEMDDGYREYVVESYMDICRSSGLPATMSVIDLGYIENVYEAYAGYIGSMRTDLENGAYEDILRARHDCLSFDNVDSVDLITLAVRYGNEASEALISSIDSAVVYTENTYSQEYAQGQGISAYFPDDYVNEYHLGRRLFGELGYSETVTGFYDEYVSLRYSKKYGADTASLYASSWFCSDILEIYNVENEEAGEEVVYLPGYIAEDEGKEQYWLETGDIDVLDTAAALFAQWDEEGALAFLGYLPYEKAYIGNLEASAPEQWVFLNGVPVMIDINNTYRDEQTGEWSRMASVFALVNGQDAMIRVYFDKNHPDGVIYGYSNAGLYDFRGRIYELDYDEYAPVLEFREDDRIQLYCLKLDENDYVTPVMLGGTTLYSEAELSHEDIMDLGVVLTSFTIVDVDGNYHSSDFFIFSNGNLEVVIEGE